MLGRATKLGWRTLTLLLALALLTPYSFAAISSLLPDGDDCTMELCKRLHRCCCKKLDAARAGQRAWTAPAPCPEGQRQSLGLTAGHTLAIVPVQGYAGPTLEFHPIGTGAVMWRHSAGADAPLFERPPPAV
jgi:hypothetical protein